MNILREREREREREGERERERGGGVRGRESSLCEEVHVDQVGGHQTSRLVSGEEGVRVGGQTSLSGGQNLVLLDCLQ